MNLAVVMTYVTMEDQMVNFNKTQTFRIFQIYHIKMRVLQFLNIHSCILIQATVNIGERFQFCARAKENRVRAERFALDITVDILKIP